MLAFNIEDVISVLNTCKPYLIGLAVVLVLAIVAMIACRKMARSKKFLIRRRPAGLADRCHCHRRGGGCDPGCRRCDDHQEVQEDGGRLHSGLTT